MKKVITTIALIALFISLFFSCSKDTYHCKAGKGNCREVSDEKFILK